MRQRGKAVTAGFGLRWQSEAATPLFLWRSVSESGVGNQNNSLDGPLRDQLRFPPRSKFVVGYA